MEDAPITKGTISAIIFNEVGCLVTPDQLDESDIDKIGDVVLPYEMGLYTTRTYEQFMLETCNEILMRINFIEEEITHWNMKRHHHMSKINYN